MEAGIVQNSIGSYIQFLNIILLILNVVKTLSLIAIATFVYKIFKKIDHNE
ncbi:MAG: hypothetical protein U9Q80_00100 [Bacillota bacterium]|nr:hypothetical protein [Bacillota bacterium]